MEAALPVAVKFLHKGNKELSRNMARYLSLAAIHHATLLQPHVQQIMDSVISGTNIFHNLDISYLSDISLFSLHFRKLPFMQSTISAIRSISRSTKRTCYGFSISAASHRSTREVSTS